MTTFFAHLIRSGRFGTAAFGLGTGGYALMIMLFFDTVRQQSAAFDELLKSFPEPLLQAFGLASNIQYGQVPDYLATEIYSFMWIVVALALAVTAGSAAVATELESGILSFWLAGGLSRRRYLVCRWLSFVTQLAVLIVATDLGIALGAWLLNLAVPWRGLAAVSIQGAIFTTAVYALACACSTLVSERGRAAWIALGVVFLSYFQFIAGGLLRDGKWLAQLSLFSLFESLPLLRTGALDPGRSLAGLALIMALLTFAWWRMGQRDLALG